MAQCLAERPHGCRAEAAFKWFVKAHCRNRRAMSGDVRPHPALSPGREIPDEVAPPPSEPERGCVADQPQVGACCDWLSAQSRSGSGAGRDNESRRNDENAAFAKV